MKGWRPKLVALDIDGTLVDYSGGLPAPIYDAVRRVVDAKVPVVLATGRSWLATKIVAHQLDLPPVMHVCSNGAVVVSYPPLDIVDQVTFDPARVIDEVVNVLNGAAVAGAQ